MSVRRASLLWDGPAEDVVWLLADPPPDFWLIERIADAAGVSLLRALDEQEAPTDEIAGVEVIDFLAFDAWEALPDLPVRWEVGDDEPRPLADVLRAAQARLRAQQRPGADGAAERGAGSP